MPKCYITMRFPPRAYECVCVCINKMCNNKQLIELSSIKSELNEIEQMGKSTTQTCLNSLIHKQTNLFPNIIHHQHNSFDIELFQWIVTTFMNHFIGNSIFQFEILKRYKYAFICSIATLFCHIFSINQFNSKTLKLNQVNWYCINKSKCNNICNWKRVRKEIVVIQLMSPIPFVIKEQIDKTKWMGNIVSPLVVIHTYKTIWRLIIG